MKKNMEGQKVRRRITWLLILFVWGSALVIAVGISYFSKLNIWLCLGIVVVAWVINGAVAEIEDRLPGGFLNTKDKSKNSEKE